MRVALNARAVHVCDFMAEAIELHGQTSTGSAEPSAPIPADSIVQLRGCLAEFQGRSRH
jgi:hypothetical protein